MYGLVFVCPHVCVGVCVYVFVCVRSFACFSGIVLPSAKLLNARAPVFLDVHVLLYGFDVFVVDDGVAAAPVILWSRWCVDVVGLFVWIVCEFSIFAMVSRIVDTV